MEVEFFAMGYGDVTHTMLDMSEQDSRDKFQSDKVGLNWSAPFAGLENWVAYSGNQGAATFNSASIPNLNANLVAPLANVATGWLAV